MTNSITLGTPGSDKDRERDEGIRSITDKLTELVAMKKGAMYDYCILRGLEIAVPDAGMRKLFMEHGQAVPGLGVTTSYQNVPEHCEKVTVTYLGKTLVEGVISSTVFADRIEVKMVSFKIRNAEGEMEAAPHIYAE